MTGWRSGMGSSGLWSRSPLALVGAALVGAATVTCRSEPTGPSFPSSYPFYLSVSATAVQGPTLWADQSDRRMVTCNFQLEADAAGTGTAVWKDAVFYLLPPKGVTPLGSTDEPADSIVHSWGDSTIAAGAVEHSGWSLTASVPYVLDIRYHFQVIGRPSDSTDVTVACTLPLPVGPPPTIGSFTADTSTVLEPGKVLALDMNIASAVGLWQTAIMWTGPCDTVLTYDESLEHSLVRAESYTLPAGCRLGVPLTATLVALDADLQVGQRSLPLAALVDTTPPTLSVWLGPACPHTVAAEKGYCFPGDSIQAVFTATDNHRLAYVGWDLEPAGYRDSVAAAGVTAGASLSILVPPSWVGANRLLIFARDSSGNTRTFADSVFVYPTVTAPALVAAVPGAITDIAFDTLRNVIYALSGDLAHIAVFSPATGAVTSTIALGDSIHTLDLSVSGDSIISVAPGSHALIVVNLLDDPPAVTAVPLVGLDTTTAPWYVRVTSAGTVFLLQTAYSSGHVYTYDLRTGVLRRRFDAGNGGETVGGPMERSIDRSMLVINSLADFQRYDAASDSFEPPRQTNAVSVPPAIDAHGRRVAIGSVIYDSTLQPLSSVRFTGLTAISPDGQTGYTVTGAAYVLRSSVNAGTIQDRILAPMPTWDMRLSPDGRTLALWGWLPSLATGGIGVMDLTRISPVRLPPSTVAVTRVTARPTRTAAGGAPRGAALPAPPRPGARDWRRLLGRAPTWSLSPLKRS